jgi:outer membrane protein OmpA-like peptidoglycan-associated protein
VAAPGLPAYVTLPSQVQLNSDSLVAEDFGAAEFYLPGKDEPVVQKGRHWNINMKFDGVPDGTTNAAVWALIKPSLLKGGWTVAGEFATQPYVATLRYQKNSKDAWIALNIFASDDIRMDVVEMSAPALTLTLKAPASSPEKINAESGDFPYLTPLPGSKTGGGSHEDGPMLVAVAQGSDEQQAVGSGSYKKDYTAPAGISTLLFVTEYHDALTKSGWTIVQQSQGLHQADADLTAHYTANGRDIWAYLHNAGDEYFIRVADAGAEDFGKELDGACHVALYGIHFDFNKATLRPDSDPVLQKVLSLLKARPDLKLEVQGHTDNVGGADYNQKLSDARASTVVAWLKTKGITADRLSARGYGLTKPVADNDSDEGRAKNRRVELQKLGCGK